MSSDSAMSSSRPYLLRALYDWIVDNGLTPYVLVDAEHEGASVPQDYVEQGKIVLNLAPAAISALELGNEWVLFDARFGGRPMRISFPITAVQAIYAKENGQGMVFSTGDDGEPAPEPPPSPPENEPSRPRRPHLKVVK